MAEQKSPYLLKILSGANFGAKVQLELRSYTIGQSTECDVVLHDQYIAPQHVKLLVTKNGIIVKPLANPVFIDGKDIGGRETRLHPYQVVTLGKVHFAIGSATKPWPKIQKPVLQHPAQKQRRAKNKANNTSSDNSPSLWKYLIGGLALLLIANLLYFKPDVSGVLNTVGATKPVETQVEESIQTLGFPNLSIDTLKNDKVRVSGYVQNKQEKQALLNKITNLDKPIAHRIWVANELAEHANYISASYGESDIRFTMQEDGVLTARGYVNNASNWNNARLAILSDIDGIKNIKDEGVDSLQQQLEKFKAYIEKESFSKRVSLAILEGKITVTGELTDAEIVRWRKIKKDFFEAHGNIPDLVENLQSPRSRFKLAIKGVSVGKVPFITSKDDKKYLVGSHLGEGYYVKSISSDKIILRHNDIEIPVYFGKRDKENATNVKQPRK